MIVHEGEYIQFIIERGVGANDRVASSPDSYVSYLRSVSSLLNLDISPGHLGSENGFIRLKRTLFHEGHRFSA